jgi:hypothetical protein
MASDFARLVKKYNYDPTEAARVLGVNPPAESAPRSATLKPTARDIGEVIQRLRSAGVDNRLLQGIIKKPRNRSGSW